MKKLIMALIVSIIFISGCTILQSSEQRRTASNSITESDAGGIGYFLPKGIIRLQYPNDTNRINVETKYVPDPKYFYPLKYKGCPISSDEITIELTENGLLKSIKTITEDKTVEIIEKISKTLQEIGKAAVLPKGTTPALDVFIDPDDFIFGKEGEIEIPLIIPGREGGTIKLKHLGAPVITAKEAPARDKGIYYRPLLPYILKINYGGIYQEDLVYLPNGAPILSLDIKRAAFVRKEITVNFKNGILSDLYIKKPSELSAAVDIPLNLAKTIVALPSELIQVKIGYSDARTRLLTQQLNELNAKQALMQAEQKKIEMQLSNPAGKGGSGQETTQQDNQGSVDLSNKPKKKKLVKPDTCNTPK